MPRSAKDFKKKIDKHSIIFSSYKNQATMDTSSVEKLMAELRALKIKLAYLKWNNWDVFQQCEEYGTEEFVIHMRKVCDEEVLEE